VFPDASSILAASTTPTYENRPPWSVFWSVFPLIPRITSLYRFTDLPVARKEVKFIDGRQPTHDEATTKSAPP